MQPHDINEVIATVKDAVSQSLKEKEEEVRRTSDQQLEELKKKVGEIELQWTSWKKV